MTEKKREILFDAEQIKETVKRLGAQISEEYGDEPVVVVPLLRGSFIFAADLVREITSPVIVDFMTTSSYDDGESSSGNVRVLQQLRQDIRDKHVLIVDDICDSGNTAKKILDVLAEEEPKTLKMAVMLDKPSRREANVAPDFIGETIDDVFIVGYGLNYGDFYRNVPYIFTFVN